MITILIKAFPSFIAY